MRVGATVFVESAVPTNAMQAQSQTQTHPSHQDQLGQLNRITGQLAGIRKMIENQRYCPEIITQIQAARASLKSVSLNILEQHLENCIVKAIGETNDDQVKDKKIQEVIRLLRSSR